MNNRLQEAFNFAMSEEDIGRIFITFTHKGEKVIKLDLHNMNCKKARRLVSNTIALTEGAFYLRIIHGYNGGTTLRKMVRKKLQSCRILEKVAVPWNPGETYLRIA